MLTFVLGGVATAGMVAAATADDPYSLILGTGVTGAVLILFITGLIVPRSTVTQKDAEILRLQTLFTDEVIPMVKTYTETMTTVSTNLEESTEALRTLAEIQRERMMKGRGL